jgi:hypothetical protein
VGQIANLAGQVGNLRDVPAKADGLGTDVASAGCVSHWRRCKENPDFWSSSFRCFQRCEFFGGGICGIN